jgi:hypothetical protein
VCGVRGIGPTFGTDRPEGGGGVGPNRRKLPVGVPDCCPRTEGSKVLDGLAEPSGLVGCWLPVLICDAGLLFVVDAVDLGADMVGYVL